MDKTKELLDEVIVQELSEIAALESGTEDKTKAIDGLTKLYRLRIDENKNQSEIEGKWQDTQLAMDQMTEKDKDRYVTIGIESAKIVLPLIFYGIWMKKGFKFEETGMFTSTTFRGLINKFKPTR